MIRHMFVVSKSLLRPPRTPLKCTKCLLLHLLTFLCSLCCVWHLPPTDKLVFSLSLPLSFWISSNTSICILNMSRKWLPPQLLSLRLADKPGMSVYVTQTKYTSLQIAPRQHVLQGAVAQTGVTGSHKQSVSNLNSDKLQFRDHRQDIFNRAESKNNHLYIMHSYTESRKKNYLTLK